MLYHKNHVYWVETGGCSASEWHNEQLRLRAAGDENFNTETDATTDSESESDVEGLWRLETLPRRAFRNNIMLKNILQQRFETRMVVPSGVGSDDDSDDGSDDDFSGKGKKGKKGGGKKGDDGHN